jgi:hypothetical protein
MCANTEVAAALHACYVKVGAEQIFFDLLGVLSTCHSVKMSTNIFRCSGGFEVGLKITGTALDKDDISLACFVLKSYDVNILIYIA